MNIYLKKEGLCHLGICTCKCGNRTVFDSKGRIVWWATIPIRAADAINLPEATTWILQELESANSQEEFAEALFERYPEVVVEIVREGKRAELQAITEGIIGQPTSNTLSEPPLHMAARFGPN